MTNPNTQLDTVEIKHVVTPAVSPAMMDALNEAAPSISISGEYLSFKEPGDCQRVFWVGMTEMKSQNNDRMIPAAVFMWQDPNSKITKRVVHAGDNIIKTLDKFPFDGTPVPMKITYLGKKKANSGNTFNAFDIVVLNVGGHNNAPPPPVEGDILGEELHPVGDSDRAAVSTLRNQLDNKHFNTDALIAEGVVVVKAQLAARGIDADAIKAKHKPAGAKAFIVVAVNEMLDYDAHAPHAEPA